MLSQTKSVLTVIVIVSIVLSVGNVQAVDLPETAISYDTISYPYLAQPVSGRVNIRSGGGIAFYPCGKLKEGVNITVVAEELGWAKIVPPKGSFSWIAKKYVDVDPSNPKVGNVNADDVRVWVGSPSYDALTSSSTQVKLSKKDFDFVELLGEEEDDYLKIAPPSGAYLYVSAKEIKYIGPVGTIPSIIKKGPGLEQDNGNDINTDTGKIATRPPVDHEKTMYSKSTSRSPDDMKLITVCRRIVEKVEAEKEKPYAMQNYTEFKKAVEKVANDPKAAQAKAYAKYLKNLIGRYELVSIVDSLLQEQSIKLTEGLKEIEDELIKAKEAVTGKDSGKYVVKGIIKPSNIYISGKKRYLILDQNLKIICYAVPSNVPEGIMEKYYDKKVALQGSIEKKSDGSVSLVKFTAITLEESIEK
ncbi:MAG: hypothetical protein FVQ82_03105 [Planctomycetes bacterium]|nr:hypothetical protein [Planctomycetota bacterium]